MADYLGTNGDDILDQKKLGLTDWSGTIRGLAGNDRLTGGAIHLQGGAGNDTLTGTSTSTTVNYWDSPSGATVNLATGTAKDGWGGQDTLINIHIVQGSNYADQFIGSALADNFWVGAGDTIQAGAGVDTVTVWDTSTRWKINKIDSQRVQVVQLSTGKTIELTNVEKLQFQDVTVNLLYGEKAVYQDTQSTIVPGGFLTCSTADINKDGRWDLVVSGGSFPPNPAIEKPAQVLLQQADGSFKKASISGSAEGFIHPREIATGDFNGDGITDIVVIGHGYDISPFPGETPTVLLGQKGGGFTDISETLPQTPAFTHSVTVADVNRDGFDDVFLGNIWGQQQFPPKLLMGLPTGRFTEAALPNSVGINALKTSGTVPIASLFCDVTGDGWVDLIAGGGESGQYLYTGLPVSKTNLAGPFFSERTALPAGRFGNGSTVTIDIQALDINRDGRQDLLLSQTNNGYQGRAIQVLTQTAQGQWQDETDLRLHGLDASAQWITFINLVDLNQDGHTDLLASGTSNQSDCAFINDGTGHFYPAGPNNGVPSLSEGWLLPAEAGKLLAVQASPEGLLSVRAIELTPGLTGPQWRLPALAGAPGFNEQYYLQQHPDTAANVAAGSITSGLAHYLASGMKAGARAYAPGTQVWGQDGLDTVRYTGNAASHKLQRQSEGNWRLTGGTTGSSYDTFINVERIQFSDKAIALDLNDNAGQVAKTLGAVFGKTAVSNKEYAGLGLHFMDDLNYSYNDLMQLALQARLGANPTPAQVVDLLYTNVVGKAPDAATRKTFTDLLDNRTHSMASLGVLAADTDLNKTQINLVGLVQNGLEYTPNLG
jgi:hypothetical protein